MTEQVFEKVLRERNNEELEFITPEWIEFVKNLKRKPNDENTEKQIYISNSFYL